MHMRRFFVLLVVLALSSLLLSGIADSAVRTTAPDASGETTGGVVFKEGGGADGGDDDRWGDSSPTIPTEEDPTPGVGAGNSEGGVNGALMRMFTPGELWSMQARIFFSFKLI